MTLRQLADELICAAGDAEREFRFIDPRERDVRVGDAIIDVLKAHGITQDVLDHCGTAPPSARS